MRSNLQIWLEPSKADLEHRRNVPVSSWKELIRFHERELREWQSNRANYPCPVIDGRQTTLADKDDFIHTHLFWITEYTEAMNARMERDARGD